MKIKDITTENLGLSSYDKDLFYLVRALQKNHRANIQNGKEILLLPDFVNYSRMLSAGKYVDCLKEFLRTMKIWKCTWLNIRNIFALLPMEGVFWSAALEMCLIELSSLKKDGNIVIHPFLIDLALHSGKERSIMKIIKSARHTTTGKVGIWTRNINYLFEKINLQKIDVDFIITPFNKDGIGMRVDAETIEKTLKKNNILLIRDYSTHFKSFDIEYNEKDDLIYI